MKKTFGTALFALLVASSAQAQGDFYNKYNDFKTIFNELRVKQAKNIPWAGSYWAYSENGIADGGPELSPAAKFDKAFKLGTKTYEWEMKSHSCAGYTGEMLKSCKGWWGHCNAWSAAAIREPEPRAPASALGMQFSVADQKAYLTELWMDSDSLFAGDSPDKGTVVDSWILSNSEEARKFWDVTPKQFFLIYTNYIGARGTGVVIDRFTGDEVWNQPIAGYRILPVQKQHVTEVDAADGKRWAVKLTMVFYWADDGVPGGYISPKFDINTISSDGMSADDTSTPNGLIYEFENQKYHAYSGRKVSFKLFFDEEPKFSADGKKVISAGRIVGPGVWVHQEELKKRAAAGTIDWKEERKTINRTHPDFIWLPTDLWGRDAGNSQTYEKRVRDIVTAKANDNAETATPPAPVAPTQPGDNYIPSPPVAPGPNPALPPEVPEAPTYKHHYVGLVKIKDLGEEIGVAAAANTQVVASWVRSTLAAEGMTAYVQAVDISPSPEEDGYYTVKVHSNTPLDAGDITEAIQDQDVDVRGKFSQY